MTSCVDMILQPRYVVNQVTAGDYDCPRKVLKFLTDLHAAFRMLNLRNDFLRKKFDGRIIVFMLFHSSFVISQKEYLCNFCFILFSPVMVHIFFMFPLGSPCSRTCLKYWLRMYGAFTHLDCFV